MSMQGGDEMELGKQIKMHRQEHLNCYLSSVQTSVYNEKMGNSAMELPIYLENYAIFKALHRFKHHLV